MNRIDTLSTQPQVTARPSAIVLSSVPHLEKGLTEKSPYGNVSDYRACVSVWERARCVPLDFWRTLAPRHTKSVESEILAVDALAGHVSYRAIAEEVQCALEHGWGESTAFACILLASIALERSNGGEDALALAQSAVDLAARLDQQDRNSVRVIHASLISARTLGLNCAYDLLNNLCKNEVLPLAAQLHMASSAFAAGVRLTELSRHFDTAQKFSSSSKPPRLALIQSLLYPHSRPSLIELSLGNAIGEKPTMHDWLTQLQACVYVGKHEDALVASRNTASLIGTLTPVGDRLSYHLFSAIALGRSNVSEARSALTVHCRALYRFACACSGIRAITELASAVRDLHFGRTLAGLHGLERACDASNRTGLHWVAALASEEAALAASKVGLDSAAANYRLQALAYYKEWGALGRVDLLKREWGDFANLPVTERCAVSEHLRPCINAEVLGLSIAHEVNQPLAAIALHSAAARKWLRHGQPNIERALSSLTLISEAGRHAAEVVRSVQRLASQQENDTECTEVDQTIGESLRSLQRSIRKHAIDIELALELGSLIIHANRAQIRQVVTNLLVNAIEALASTDRSLGQRCIRIESRSVHSEEVEIIVVDNGPGIAPPDRERIFRSLFTTKPDNSGLGLSISLSIVQAHHGSIEYEPHDPYGACFRVRLPVGAPKPPGREAAI